jgi:AcrR family transcriptional regulator
MPRNRLNEEDVNATAPIAETPQAREAATRARIVETAEKLFRQLGYNKTTVADIARELSMSAGNVYRFFASKADIVACVAEQLMGEVEAAAKAIAESEGGAADRLRSLVQTVARMSEERYLSDFKLHEMVAIALTENWPIIHAHIQRMHGFLARIIADGISSGEFRAMDVTVAAHQVHTALVRFSHPRLMVECAAFEIPTLDQQVDFCLAALRA